MFVCVCMFVNNCVCVCVCVYVIVVTCVALIKAVREELEFTEREVERLGNDNKMLVLIMKA